VRDLLERHVELSGSDRGRRLLHEWDEAAYGFWRIAPRGRLARFERSDRGVGTTV
jgi:glutamate synthase domain-containing protein 3